MVERIDDITLIVFSVVPSDIEFACTVLSTFADYKVSVDMISVGSPAGINSNMAITVSDDMLQESLQAISHLREIYRDLKMTFSSHNCKISVCNEKMKDKPGVASDILSAAYSVHADIRLITASLIDVSMLVTAADADSTFDSVKKVII